MSKEEKTNVMRILDSKNIVYSTHMYLNSDAIAAGDVAKYLGQNPCKVFKTLVTVGKSKQYYVFMLPSLEELDLKKAAQAVGEKSVEMIKSKELLPTTGYIHGGCSPIGMKKFFRTTIHESAKNFDTILFSGGKIGYQVETSTTELEKVIPVSYADIIKKI